MGNGDKDGSIWLGILIVLFFFSLAFSVIRDSYISNDYQAYCNRVYGEDLFYGSERGMAYEIRSCNHLSEDGNLTKKYFTVNQFERYCNPPDFWDLKRWDGGCKQ